MEDWQSLKNDEHNDGGTVLEVQLQSQKNKEGLRAVSHCKDDINLKIPHVLHKLRDKRSTASYKAKKGIIARHWGTWDLHSEDAIAKSDREKMRNLHEDRDIGVLELRGGIKTQ